ncbi:MAG TPA: substrate-binding domain-containing protein [Devosia sp.]|nr:substrate-binding domain-containing protein [Devosia sp.]
MRLRTLVALSAALTTAGYGGAVLAQSIDKAVGGYTWEEAAKEAAGTKDFHSADGHLTFAIVTHTAGNGFFDPVYVGAQVAADAFGINLIRLGSEAAVDDIPREIEILNQIIQDPTIDGLILTTPQQGAYDDIVKTMLDKGVPVATTNSFDPTLYDRNGISHTGQSAAAAAIGGEALAKCLIDSGKTSGSIIFPSQTTAGNVEVNERVTNAFNAVVAALDKAGVLSNFTVDAGPENIGIPVNDNDIAGSIVTYFESRGDVVGVFGPNGAVTPAIVDAVTQAGRQNDICAFGYDLGPKQQEGLKTGALTGSLGQQPFIQGFWPVMQLYLQIDRGVQAANVDTRAQLVTKDTVDLVGKRYEN